MNIKLHFASYFYETRQKNHLTQEKMAEALDVSVRWYQNFECGAALPNCRVICLLVKNFNCNMPELLKEVSTDDLLQTP